MYGRIRLFQFEFHPTAVNEFKKGKLPDYEKPDKSRVNDGKCDVTDLGEEACFGVVRLQGQDHKTERAQSGENRVK